MFAKIYDIQKCGCVYGTKYGRNVIYRNGTMYKTMYIYTYTRRNWLPFFVVSQFWLCAKHILAEIVSSMMGMKNRIKALYEHKSFCLAFISFLAYLNWLHKCDMYICRPCNLFVCLAIKMSRSKKNCNLWIQMWKQLIHKDR